MRYTSIGLLALGTTACMSVHVDERAGAVQTERVTLDRGKAEMVRMEVKMGAGELKVHDAAEGADKLLDASFEYNMGFLKPVVRYDDTSFRGRITVEQQGKREIRLGGDMKNNWDLRVHRDVPLELNVNLGAGESTLDLGKLSLRRVQVHMGVGEVRMDLRGEPQRDYDVEVHGGVGEATIYLPARVGVSAETKGGIGSIDVEGGLRKDGGRWVNDAYGKSKVNVRVDVRGGVGSIKLIGG